MAQFIRKSIISGVTRTRELNITTAQLARYQAGAKVQDAFPHLSADDREFFMTGITAEEWDGAFGEKEPDTDELFEDLDE